jgi:hypothetical protein
VTAAWISSSSWLERAEAYELTGDELRLRDAGGVVARFRRTGA